MCLVWFTWLPFQRVEKSLLLIAHGIDVDAQDAIGWTALHYAVSSQCIALTKVLIKNKANVELCDKRGQTPLAIAKKINCADLVR